MKQIRNIALIAIASLVLVSCGKKSQFEDASAYNDFIVDQVDHITAGIDELSAALDQDSGIAAVDDMRKVLLDSAKKTQATLEKLEDWDGDGNFRKAALDMVKVYVEVLSNDYADLFKMVGDMENADLESDSASQALLQSYEKMGEMVEKADAKVEVVTNKAQEAQQAFGKKHNLTIIPGRNSSPTEN